MITDKKKTICHLLKIFSLFFFNPYILDNFYLSYINYDDTFPYGKTTGSSSYSSNYSTDSKPVANRTRPDNIKYSKMFHCNCGRNYSLLRNLNYHKRWECGREYCCPSCTKIYKDLSSFRKHCKACVGEL